MQRSAIVLACFAVNCFTSFGQLDTSFHPRLPSDCNVKTVCEQSNGKLIVGGSIGAAWEEVPFLVRLERNGSIDKSFQVKWANPGKEMEGATIDQAQVRPDGDVAVIGNFTRIRGVEANFTAVFTKHGALRRSYHTDELVGVYGWGPITLLEDGSILYPLTVPDPFRPNLYRGELRLLNANGDVSWTSEPIGLRGPYWGEGISFAWCDRLPDGTFVGGMVNPQVSFKNQVYVNYYLYSSAWGFLLIEGAARAVWPDFSGYDARKAHAVFVPGPTNSLYVGGGQALGMLTRRVQGWQIDPSFVFQSPNTNAAIQTIAVQPDGKLLYAFVTSSTNQIYRCFADGSPDASFTFGTDAKSSVQHLLVLRNGQTVAWGSYVDESGIPKSTLVRLNTK